MMTTTPQETENLDEIAALGSGGAFRPIPRFSIVPFHLSRLPLSLEVNGGV